MADLVRYKLVFLGDEAVGKSSIITSFQGGRFETVYKWPTIGIDFLSETIKHEDTTLRLRLWDTAGQERFRSLMPSFKDSSVAVIVYDVSNRQSFLNTPKWIEDVRMGMGNNGIIVLVGNKADLVTEGQVSIEEGGNKAREFGANLFIETSAKLGFNTKALFSKIASELQRLEKLASTIQED